MINTCEDGARWYRALSMVDTLRHLHYYENEPATCVHMEDDGLCIITPNFAKDHAMKEIEHAMAMFCASYQPAFYE
jgi:hypothetical protein